MEAARSHSAMCDRHESRANGLNEALVLGSRQQALFIPEALMRIAHR